MRIRAISLYEPWATAVMVGAKTYETRSWPTNYRGDLLICAGKHCDVMVRQLLRDTRWIASIGKLQVADLHFGKAVAICELTDCILTDILTPSAYRDQKHLGDYGSRRWAWQLENIRPLAPTPVRGKQGLFWVEMTEPVLLASK